MSVISLEEYKRIVAERFRIICKAYPQDQVEQYLREQEAEIEDCYRGELAVMDITKCPPSPFGCAYAMSLEF